MKRSTQWKATAAGACLAMIALGTASGAPAGVEPQYTVLDPEAPLPEVDTKALSPRLSGFAGKTIVVYDNRGGYEKPMRGLADQLEALLPEDTRLVYYTPTTTSWNAADQARIPLGDAAIVGHGY